MSTDGAALPALLTHAAWLRRLAFSLVRDPDAAEDVVQGTLVAAWSRPPAELREPGQAANLRPWLAEVARNQAHDLRRGERRRQLRESTAGSSADAGAGPAVPATPEQLIGNLEIHRAVAEVVTALDEPYRTTVIAHYYEGVALVELASRLGVPAGTVRWRLKEGLDRVRVALDGRYGERGRWQQALLPLLPAAPLAGAGTGAGAAAAAGGAGATSASRTAATANASAARVSGRRLLPAWPAPLWAIALISLVLVLGGTTLWLRGRSPAENPPDPARIAASDTRASGAPLAARKAVPRLAPVMRAAGAQPANTEAESLAAELLRHMLAAVAAGDYDAMVLHGSDVFKAHITKDVASQAHAELGPRLRGGYETHPLGTIRRGDHTGYLYKLEFRDAGEDVLIRLAVGSGEVVGFWME